MNFMEGLTQGLSVGIPLADQLEQQRTANATREANEILAEGQAWDPREGAMGALPAEGQATRGYDGAPLLDLESRYRAAAARIGDPQAYGRLMQNYGEFRLTKIQGYLEQAELAAQQGDTVGAASALGAVVSFVDPDTVSEVNYEPNTHALVVANYDRKGQPVGGMAIPATPEAIQQAMVMFQDPKAYATLMEGKRQHADEMAVRWANHNANVKAQNAASLIAQSEDARKNEKHLLDMARGDLELQQAEITLGEMQATTEGKTTAAQWENYGKAVTAREEARKDLEAPVTETLTELDKLIRNDLPTDPQLAGEMQDDIAMAATTDDDGNKSIPDSWWHETNSDGLVQVKPEMATAAASLAMDIAQSDPYLPAVVRAGMVEGAFGRSQSAQVTLDEDGTATLTTPSLDEVEISGESAATILKWRRSMAEGLMGVQTTAEGQQRVAANTAQAQGAIPETPPMAASAAPMAPPEAAPPEVGGGIPGALPGPAPAAAAPVAPPAGAMPAGPAPAPAGIPAPAQVPTMPRAVDDTAARSGVQDQAQGVVMSTPVLLEAAQTWVAAGQPQEGPEAEHLARVLHSLPSKDRWDAMHELGLTPR